MVRGLTLPEAVVAVLLLAALIWAAVQVGPTAIERWF
jgi:type II secretory pathway component PulJ